MRGRRRPRRLSPESPELRRQERELQYVRERYAAGGYTPTELDLQVERILRGSYANEPTPAEVVADFLAKPQ